VGGVRCESLLLGDLRLEAREHRVEGVGELAELVATARQPDPVGERSGGGQARGVRDARQRREHLAGEDPASHEPEGQQEGERDGCLRGEGVLEVGAIGDERAGDAARSVEDQDLGDVAQQEHPHHGEEQGPGDHEEAGVAEGELEADAQARGPIHGRRPRRCGTRRRARWR
jgi:hypothetical protein